MPFNVEQIEQAIKSLFAGFLDRFWNEWTLIQIALILTAALLAWLIGRRIAPVANKRAHDIKGNADLLRLVIALVRRLNWTVFVILLFGLRLALNAARQPYDVVAVALVLAGSWLALAVLTRIIRNRTLARLVAIGGWIYVAILVLGIEPQVTGALEATAVTIGAVRLSALTVIKAALVATGLLWLALFVSRIVESRLQRATDISPSYQVLFGKLIRIGLVLLAGVIALSATGVDLTALTLFSGAIGVGLGFGLQKVVSNFVSGIIILMDRSIKPGDTIALGETFGWIQELRSRFVSVITRDGRKYLIPNEDFITQQVINWSYSDKFVRLDVPFSVAYSSDPRAVTALAIKSAMTVPRVSDYREPVCWLTALGDNGIEMVLRFWISDPQNGLTNVRGQVLLALWDALKAAGVEIPFPQRDLTFRNPLEVVTRRGGEGPAAPQPSVNHPQDG